MPGANPLVNGRTTYASTAPPPPADTQGSVYPSARLTGVQAPLTGDHNIAAHVGFIVLAALGVIVLLHTGGFRFVVDAGVVRGAR